MYRKAFKSALAVMVLFYGICSYTASKLPDVIHINLGDSVKIRSVPFVNLYPTETKATKSETADSLSSKYSARLLGLINVKEVAVVQGEERYVAVSGKPIGIKMFCDGVMVVGFSDILTSGG